MMEELRNCVCVCVCVCVCGGGGGGGGGKWLNGFRHLYKLTSAFLMMMSYVSLDIIGECLLVMGWT